MNRYFKYGLSIVVAVFSFGLTTAVLANGLYAPPAPTAQPYFSGPYVGIGAGMVHANYDVKSFTDWTFGYEEAITTKYDVTHEFDGGKYGLNANIFAGYGQTLGSRYYLGGELFGNYFTPKVENSFSMKFITPEQTNVITTTLNMNIEVKNRYSLGGDIRAGYLVLPRTMVYVLLGLDYAKFDIKYNVFGQTKNNFTWPGELVVNDFNKWKLGYMPGVGIETSLADHVSLRTEYTYTYYPSISHTVSYNRRSVYPYYDSLYTSVKVKPSRGLFTVKLSYLFN